MAMAGALPPTLVHVSGYRARVVGQCQLQELKPILSENAVATFRSLGKDQAFAKPRSVSEYFGIEEKLFSSAARAVFTFSTHARAKLFLDSIVVDSEKVNRVRARIDIVRLRLNHCTLHAARIGDILRTLVPFGLLEVSPFFSSSAPMPGCRFQQRFVSVIVGKPFAIQFLGDAIGLAYCTSPLKVFLLLQHLHPYRLAAEWHRQ